MALSLELLEVEITGRKTCLENGNVVILCLEKYSKQNYKAAVLHADSVEVSLCCHYVPLSKTLTVLKHLLL